MTTSYRKAKVVGIIGGMGPAATIRLYQEIINRTPIRAEQDHIPLLIDSDPTIPDRTAAILAAKAMVADAAATDNGGDTVASPEAYLIAAGQRLEQAGAELVAMACNTAHYWYRQIADAISVPMLDLIEVTSETVARRCPVGGRVGLLATDATIVTELYAKALEAHQLKLILPTPDAQREVMAGIRQVKQNHGSPARQTLHRQAEALAEAGADAVILGCTDISVVLADGDLSVPIVDSTVALAERIIEQARCGRADIR